MSIEANTVSFFELHFLSRDSVLLPLSWTVQFFGLASTGTCRCEVGKFSSLSGWSDMVAWFQSAAKSIRCGEGERWWLRSKPGSGQKGQVCRRPWTGGCFGEGCNQGCLPQCTHFSTETVRTHFFPESIPLKNMLFNYRADHLAVEAQCPQSCVCVRVRVCARVRACARARVCVWQNSKCLPQGLTYYSSQDNPPMHVYFYEYLSKLHRVYACMEYLHNNTCIRFTHNSESWPSYVFRWSLLSETFRNGMELFFRNIKLYQITFQLLKESVRSLLRSTLL